jgi:hypothetical protein
MYSNRVPLTFGSGHAQQMDHDVGQGTRLSSISHYFKYEAVLENIRPSCSRIRTEISGHRLTLIPTTAFDLKSVTDCSITSYQDDSL